MMDEKKKRDFGIDVVGSIFDRHKDGKKEGKVSSLFTPASKPESEIRAKIEASAKDTPVQRKYPVSLDIGSNAIKVVQLARTFQGGLRIVKLGLQPFAQDLANLKPKERSQFLNQAIKEFIQLYKIEGEIVSSVSSNKAQIKRIDLPSMPEAEIENALRWKIQQTPFFNLDINDLVLDYATLQESSTTAEQGLKLLVVAVLKKDIFEHLDILESCGLRPKAVETDPFACACALNHAYQFSSQEVVIFLDFGSETNSFNVIANNELRYSRNLYTTGNSLTRSICEANSLDFQKAEELKKSQGLLGDVRQSISPALDDLILDIEHSFKYFSYELSQSSIAKFDKVFLCGGTANLKGLIPFLQDKLNSSIEIANPFKRTEISDDIGRKMINLEEITPQFSVAFGLALRGL